MKVGMILFGMMVPQIPNSVIKQGIDVDVFVDNNVVGAYKEGKFMNLGEIKLGNRLKVFKSLKKIKDRLMKIIKSKNYDLLHLNSQTHATYFLRNKNIPLIVTLHGTDVYEYINCKKILYNILSRPFITKVLDKASVITSVSSHQIQNLPTKYKKKTVIIPNGVDSKEFRPIKSIKQKKNVILFVGRFIDIKGVRELLSVAKKLPKYEFWFAGWGDLSDKIKGNNIKNLGMKKTDELIKLYNQATICVFPSYREPFGLVGLEAMACGRAVIATPLGFTEYIENGKDGIIIPAKDEKALKEAVVDLMNDSKKRKTLEINARKKALKFTWDEVAKKYVEVYKKVIAQSK